MSYIEVADISKSYKKHRALSNVSLSIKQGRITAVAGASGSGKTTLLKAIYGLVDVDSGKVFIEGEEIIGPSQKLIPGNNRMKLVDQQFELNWHATIWDNVSSQLPNTDLKSKVQRTEWLLQRMRIADLRDKKVNDLSGGEMQRVAIARALAMYPDVLLLDEPFNQVDTSFREFLQQDIRNYVRENGLTVILVSHDPAEVLSLADELIIIRDGHIIEKGNPQELYRQPKTIYTAQLLGNGNVLNTYAAKQCGIHTKSAFIMVYPEWVSVNKSLWSGKVFTVKEVLFKGFYEELIVEKDDVQLRVHNEIPGKYQPGGVVKITVKKFVEFET